MTKKRRRKITIHDCIGAISASKRQGKKRGRQFSSVLLSLRKMNFIFLRLTEWEHESTYDKGGLRLKSEKRKGK